MENSTDDKDRIIKEQRKELNELRTRDAQVMLLVKQLTAARSRTSKLVAQLIHLMKDDR